MCFSSGSDYIVSEKHPSIPGSRIEPAAALGGHGGHWKLAGVAIVKMQRAPVNSLDLDYLAAIPELILALEKDDSVRGIILRSVRSSSGQRGKGWRWAECRRTRACSRRGWTSPLS